MNVAVEPNSSMPSVSVIVPNYNYARFLKERMESILSQTFTDYEIILLDDASTDGSEEILRLYAGNPKVSFIEIRENNSGNPFIQWERGLKVARGKYVWIAESDDMADAGFLGKSVALLERHKDAVVCFSSSTVIDDKSMPVKRDMDHWHRRGIESGSYYVYGGTDFNKSCQFWSSYIYNASGTVFRKIKEVDSIICYAKRFRYTGDLFFWTMLADYGKVVMLNERLNLFRRHQSSVTAVGKKDIAYMYEQMAFVHDISSHYGIDGYKMLLRVGVLYKKICSMRLMLDDKKALKREVKNITGIGIWSYYVYVVSRLMSAVIAFIPVKNNEYRRVHRSKLSMSQL